MNFTCECFRCGEEFTEPLPRVLCPPCRPLFITERLEDRRQFYRKHPDAPRPGDRVRLLTEDERAFVRDVATDVAAL